MHVNIHLIIPHHSFGLPLIRLITYQNCLAVSLHIMFFFMLPSNYYFCIKDWRETDLYSCAMYWFNFFFIAQQELADLLFLHVLLFLVQFSITTVLCKCATFFCMHFLTCLHGLREEEKCYMWKLQNGRKMSFHFTLENELYVKKKKKKGEKKRGQFWLLRTPAPIWHILRIKVNRALWWAVLRRVHLYPFHATGCCLAVRFGLFLF